MTGKNSFFGVWLCAVFLYVWCDCVDFNNSDCDELSGSDYIMLAL